MNINKVNQIPQINGYNNDIEGLLSQLVDEDKSDADFTTQLTELLNQIKSSNHAISEANLELYNKIKSIFDEIQKINQNANMDNLQKKQLIDKQSNLLYNAIGKFKDIRLQKNELFRYGTELLGEHIRDDVKVHIQDDVNNLIKNKKVLDTNTVKNMWDGYMGQDSEDIASFIDSTKNPFLLFFLYANFCYDTTLNTQKEKESTSISMQDLQKLATKSKEFATLLQKYLAQTHMETDKDGKQISVNDFKSIGDIFRCAILGYSGTDAEKTKYGQLFKDLDGFKDLFSKSSISQSGLDFWEQDKNNSDEIQAAIEADRLADAAEKKVEEDNKQIAELDKYIEDHKSDNPKPSDYNEKKAKLDNLKNKELPQDTIDAKSKRNNANILDKAYHVDEIVQGVISFLVMRADALQVGVSITQTIDIKSSDIDSTHIKDVSQKFDDVSTAASSIDQKLQNTIKLLQESIVTLVNLTNNSISSYKEMLSQLTR
jgi:hypothetical protein